MKKITSSFILSLIAVLLVANIAFGDLLDGPGLPVPRTYALIQRTLARVGLLDYTPQMFDPSCGASALHDCSLGFQSAINAASAAGGGTVRCSGRYLIGTPLNETNTTNIVIRGTGNFFSGSYDESAPGGGCTIIANTNGKEVIDAVGSSGIAFYDFAITTTGASTPSKNGILFGPASTTDQGGQNLVMDNVAIIMPTGVGSAPIYWNQGAGLGQFSNISTFGDYGYVITVGNPLSISPTYGAYSTSNFGGVDVVLCNQCSAGSTGAANGEPIYISGCIGVTFTEFYTWNQASPSSYTGTAAPIYLNNVSDITISGDVDYWPSFFVTYGTADNIRISGNYFNRGILTPPSEGLLGNFDGTSLTNSEFKISLSGWNTSGANFLYTSSGGSGTLVNIYNDRFQYNTSVDSGNVAYINNTSSSNAISGLWFDGDNGSATITIQNAGSTASTSNYRYFVNGKQYGTY